MAERSTEQMEINVRTRMAERRKKGRKGEGKDR
jgi:hypothetical protein